jgi:hypothetical protein
VAGAWLGDPRIFVAGVLGWCCMTYLYLPTVRLYEEPGWRALLLPLAALFYTAMTANSAWRTWRGRGAGWKGRSYGAPPAKPEGQVGE